MLRSCLARALAVAATCSLALVSCGDDAAETTNPAATTTAVAITTTSGAPGTGAVTTTSAATSTTAAPPTTAAVQVIEVVYRGGKVEGGGRKQVTKGKPVTLRVTSDIADEIHVHGYDKSADVAAGGTAEITFEANVAGVFEVELHKKHLKIVDLEVK